MTALVSSRWFDRQRAKRLQIFDLECKHFIVGINIYTNFSLVSFYTNWHSCSSSNNHTVSPESTKFNPNCRRLLAAAVLENCWHSRTDDRLSSPNGVSSGKVVVGGGNFPISRGICSRAFFNAFLSSGNFVAPKQSALAAARWLLLYSSCENQLPGF